jgi:hypothetical protein
MSVRRLATAAAAALAGGLLLASCSLYQVEDLPGLPGGTRVQRVTGFKPAGTPPDPRTANLTRSDLEGSLRHIVVRYTGVTRWNLSDPRPLLSEGQITAFAAVLAAELPRLRENQHLKFQFDDRENGKGFLVDMDVYREGGFLVYRFDSLATDTSASLMPGDVPRFNAVLVAQPGQEVANLVSRATVKDPLLAGAREGAVERQDKRALLDAAIAENLVEKRETARLETLVQGSTPSLDAWKTYWDKRRTLKKALDQNLLDRAAYQAQIDRLTAELER